MNRDPSEEQGGLNLYSFAKNAPVSYYDALGLKPLPDCVKKLLADYFKGLNLDKIDVHDGIPWLVKLFSAITPAAYTSKNDLYFDSGQYDPNSSAGIAIIAHELTHSKQYFEKGNWSFKWRYYWDYKKNLKAKMKEYDAYENIPFEIEARSKQTEVYNDLLTKFGKCPPCPAMSE